MKQYKVIWENEILQEDPLSAARECLNDIQNNDTLCFYVTDTETGEVFSVDLDELEGQEVLPIKTLTTR